MGGARLKAQNILKTLLFIYVFCASDMGLSVPIAREQRFSTHTHTHTAGAGYTHTTQWRGATGDILCLTPHTRRNAPYALPACVRTYRKE